MGLRKELTVSFLVTFYNQSEYVSQCLDSILALKKPFLWEILVGDDGSTDNTVSIVKQYIKKYPKNIKLFVMSREEGKKYDSILRVSANRLNLLSKCTGDYFCVMDGDDRYCDQNFVDDAVQILQANKDYSLVAFDFKFAMEKNGTTTYKYHGLAFPEGKVLASDYIKGSYTHAGACVFRQSFNLDMIQKIQNFGFFDDNNIVLLGLNKHDFYYINRPVYSYRQTGDSIWTKLTDFEQKVINSLHYDINKRYCSNYLNEIKERQYAALSFLWKNRRRYYKMLDANTAEKYVRLAEKIPDSFFLKIINYCFLDKGLKKEVQSFFENEKFLCKLKRLLKKIFIKFLHLFGSVK